MKTNLLVVFTIIFFRHVTCKNNFRQRHQHPLLWENVHRQKRRNDGQHGISRICLLKKRRTVEHLQYILTPLYFKVIQRCIIRAGIPRKEMLKFSLLQRLGGENRSSSRARVLFMYTNLMKDLITGQILLPPAYLPPLADVVLLFGLVFVHALLWLLQRWSITVKQFVAYKHVNQPYEADAVLVIPFLHAGAREVCALHLEPSLDDAVVGYGYDDFKQNEREKIANTTNHDNNRTPNDKESDFASSNVERSSYGEKKLVMFKCDEKINGGESDLGWEMDEDINSLQQETYNKSRLLKGNSTGNLFDNQMMREIETEDFPKNGKDNIENDLFVESQESDDLLYTKVPNEEEASHKNCYPVQNGEEEDDELDDDYDTNNNPIENEDEEEDEATAADVDFVESNERGGVVVYDRMLYFEYQNRRFMLSEPSHTFIIGNPQFNMIELPTKMKISHYLERSTDGLCSSSDIELARLKYGPNQLSLLPSTFRKVLMEVLFTPFKLFELFTYLLQLLDVGAQQAVQSVVFMLLSSISEANALHSAHLRTKKRSKSGVNSRRRVRVLRKGAWEDVNEEDLVPGDVVSLVSGKAAAEKHCRWKIPADMLLLCGHAVCDESSLTGESMPVPKIGISDTIAEIGMEEACNTHLDMKGVHHSNMLLSSTTLLYCRAAGSTTITGRLKSSSSMDLETSTAETEEGGVSSSDESFFEEDEIKAYVVRTGFYSTEGKLMRMAERSKEPVRADFVETGKVMLLLLGFAIFTMVYTVRRGRILVDPVHSSATIRFSNFRLIVQCVRILSVIVPPHIPYTISRRCTQALVRISAHRLVCTEPWRIPWAGCVSQVLLDKTGTLTSADLAPSEMWTWDGSTSRLNGNGTTLVCNDEPVSGTPHLAPFEMCAIISSCHSVAECHSNTEQQSSSIQNCDADERLVVGDPIEVSGLGAVNWTFNSTTDTATGQVVVLEGKYESSKVVEVGEVEVLKRFAFCSKLQRMSVLGTVKRSKMPFKFGEKGHHNHLVDDGIWCLTKGSPESILPLLEPSSIPPWYENKYKELGREGKRTIALAYNRNIVKKLGVPVLKDGAGDAVLVMKHTVAPISREDCEAHGSMQFGGFASFESPLRTDSTSVVEELQTKGGCNVTMVTGDGPYTAVAVATAAGILPQDRRPTLLLTVEEKDNKKNNTCTEVEEIDGFLGCKNKYRSARQRLVWKPLQELPREEIRREFTATSKKRDASIAFIPSRMAELSLKHSLCVTGPSLRAALSSPQRNKFRKNVHFIRVFSRMSPELKEEVTTLIASTGRIVLYCGDGGNDVGALKSAHLGVALLSGFQITKTRSGSGSHEKKYSSMEDLGVVSSSIQPPLNIQPMWCTYDEMKEDRCDDETPSFLKSLWVVLRKNTVRAMHKKREKKSIEAHAKALYGPEVDIGQASLAAPFTSSKPSISACVDLIKHGKHTAALILTIYQVVVLESMLAGYALSQLYLEGLRLSFTQKVLMTLGSMMSVYFIEEAPKDVDNCLNEHRVPESVFHPSILSSTLAQAVCHIGSCAFAIHSAKRATPLDVLKKAQIRNVGRRRFVPSLVANVMVIMSLCQRASITICSYKGWPFTRPLFNMPGMISYAFMMAMTSLLLLFNISPRLNSLLNIYPWPRGSWSLQV